MSTTLARGHNLPPGPYSFETITARGGDEGNGHVYILDATGRKIASIWGKGAEKLALAELIIHARSRVKVTP